MYIQNITPQLDMEQLRGQTKLRGRQFRSGYERQYPLFSNVRLSIRNIERLKKHSRGFRL